MDFKINKPKQGFDRVMKNMTKITGNATGDGIEDGVERVMGISDVESNLGNLQKEGKEISTKLVDKLNKAGQATSKRLNKKIEGKEKIAFRPKGKKSKRK
jgi:hypothetical protein